MFGNIGTTEILLIVGLLTLLFGAKKIPELAKGIGKGIREFKKEIKDVKENVEGMVSLDEKKQ